MTSKKEQIKTKVANAADNIAHPEQETRKEARKRQPWLPIIGSVIAGAILVALYLLFS